MRLVIALDGTNVSEHFGRCAEYAIYDTEDGKIKSRVIIANPGHLSGFLPKYFASIDTDCVVAGGVGAEALSLLGELGIDVILGVSGKAEDIAVSFLAGTLEPKQNLCKRMRDQCACQLFDQHAL